MLKVQLHGLRHVLNHCAGNGIMKCQPPPLVGALLTKVLCNLSQKGGLPRDRTMRAAAGSNSLPGMCALCGGNLEDKSAVLLAATVDERLSKLKGSVSAA